MADSPRSTGLASTGFDWIARRRDLLSGAGLLLGALALPGSRARAQGKFELPAETRTALDQRALVYVSPLLASGKESRCHAEIWYFMDGGDVIVGTSPTRWKGVAAKKGRGARVWVTGSDSETDYRKGRTFATSAKIDTDPATFQRLLASFAKKYPGEWGKWEPRFKKSYGDGSRVLIRYAPTAA